jgi:hypothetical protein
MASKFNAATHAKFQALVNTIMGALATGEEVDFTGSAGFTLVLKVEDDGQHISVMATPSNLGDSNTFGTSATEVNGRLSRGNPLKLTGSQLP